MTFYFTAFFWSALLVNVGVVIFSCRQWRRIFFAGGPLLTCEDYKTQAKVTCSRAAFVKKCLAYYNMRNSRNTPPKNSPKFSVGMTTMLLK